MTIKTAISSDHYVLSMGLVCPCCKSENIFLAGPMDSDAGIAWCERQCSRCNASWTEIYGLVSYSGLNLKGVTKLR